ncbi:uncharacterized protein LOC128231781 [Mya arenaria]|uniref:uncharacterized protein LOC128231781 n=1 Tax=Mya arenaria TaxID=6604 RepID=UPI0022DF4605|nr:uncharacterized protein LOC128231781 [Mya arenaria]XP_052800932.1 uncharacterized protein LOC128231781 [Mya arenaria]XP_052800933.1 uncharacterized protein LOC128231781 [Mya arenaria]XP_052800934.1 uncharacterized protein LOC128231781 [Mya arenaria]
MSLGLYMMEYNSASDITTAERKISTLTETSDSGVSSNNDELRAYDVMTVNMLQARPKGRISIDASHHIPRDFGRLLTSRQLSNRHSCSLPDILDIDNLCDIGGSSNDVLNKTGDSSDLNQSFEENDDKSIKGHSKYRADSLIPVHVCGKEHVEDPCFICMKDNEIYCGICVKVHNYHCKEQVKFIPEIPPELRQKYCEDAVNQLNVMRDRYLKIKQENEELQVQLKASKKDFIRSVMKYKSHIIVVIDKMEKEALQEMDVLYKSEIAKLEGTMTKMEMEITNLNSYLKFLEGSETSVENSVVFEVQEAISRVQSDENIIRDHHKMVGKVQFHFEPLKKLTDILADFNSLFSVSQTEVEICKFPMPCSCDKPYANKYAEKEKEVSARLSGWSFDRERCCITGCEFMDNGKLLTCDNANKKIKLFNKKLKCISAQSLPSQPWDIAVIDDERAVVTIPDRKQLQFLTVIHRKISLKHATSLDQNCWGVSCDADSIFVTNYSPETSEVVVLNHDGVLQRRIYGMTFHTPWFIDRFQDMLYVSDWGTFNVQTMTRGGALTNSYRNSYLVGPLGVTHDPEGNIYVCGRDSNTVHQISPDGVLRQIILRERDGVKQPLNICHRPSDDRLVITSWMSDKMTVYKLC